MGGFSTVIATDVAQVLPMFIPLDVPAEGAAAQGLLSPKVLAVLLLLVIMGIYYTTGHLKDFEK